MKTINLRVLYPDAYKSDYYVEVPDEVAEVFETFERMEKAYMQRVYYHKAYYTLDCSDEIEHSVGRNLRTKADEGTASCRNFNASG